MTFLAVYHHDNLLNPVKLLTHREDIVAVLEHVSISYSFIELVPELQGDQDDAALLTRLHSLYAEEYPYIELQRLPAIPNYARAERAQADVEHSCTDVGMRLCLQGTGVFCLNVAEQLMVLGCIPGDLLTIPAGVGHWFRQGAGSDSVIVRLAGNCAGLECAARIDGLAGKVELPEV